MKVRFLPGTLVADESEDDEDWRDQGLALGLALVPRSPPAPSPFAQSVSLPDPATSASPPILLPEFLPNPFISPSLAPFVLLVPFRP